jgi:hypothetical protein
LIKQLEGGFRAATRATKCVSDKLLLKINRSVKGGQSIQMNFIRTIIHMEKEYGRNWKKDQQKKKTKTAVMEF